MEELEWFVGVCYHRFGRKCSGAFWQADFGTFCSGIPVLEAQRAGCPVIAYNASSIPEIIGDTPLLLDVLSIESITKCFNVLKIKKEREDIIYKGIENAKRFTWDRMYEQVIALYKEVWEKIKKKWVSL